MRLEQRIVICTEVSRNTLPLNSRVEHTAHVGTPGGTAVDAETDEAPGTLIHHHEHPVALEQDGLASKEVDAPEAVCGVSDERQPRGPAAARSRAIVCRQHAIHDVLVDVDPERLRDDARNPWTAEPRIARLELDDGLDQCIVRPFRARCPRARRRREQPAVLAAHQGVMKCQERGGAEHESDLSDASRPEE